MKTKIAIILFMFVTSATRAFSFDPEPVIESTWYGYCKQYTDLFEGGVIFIGYKMYDMNYNSYDHSISGTFRAKINIDGYSYSSVYHITGTYDPDNFEIRLYSGYVISEDALPGDLYWIHNNIKTTLYEDSNNSGYYLLDGYTLDNNGYSESEVQLSNNPTNA
jgi:hypothetical protein